MRVAPPTMLAAMTALAAMTTLAMALALVPTMLAPGTLAMRLSMGYQWKLMSQTSTQLTSSSLPIM
jgi:hypothetical protein